MAFDQPVAVRMRKDEIVLPMGARGTGLIPVDMKHGCRSGVIRCATLVLNRED